MSDQSATDRIGNKCKGKRIPKKLHYRAGDKKFMCKYCGLKYFSEYRLKRHIVDHGKQYFQIQ